MSGCVAEEIFEQSHQNDYETFMRLTENDQDLFRDERANVKDAFDRLCNSLARVGFTHEPSRFEHVLAQAMGSYETKTKLGQK